MNLRVRRVFKLSSKIGYRIIVLALFFICSMNISVASQFEELSIKTQSDTHKFMVEIAVSEAEQNKGLMFRRSLDADKGMLFIYKDDKPRYMWMKNTYISLDMLFIKADGQIYHIHQDAEPFSEETISSEGPGRAVLELPAGTVERLKIKNGDYILHKSFKKQK